MAKHISLTACLLFLLLPWTAHAQTSKPLYHLVARYSLPGSGGWDYLKYDPAQNRVFVAHGNEVLVIDAANGHPLGSMPAEGVHGTALVQELGRGFFTNGRAGTVTVFDLKTLATITEIKAGENPDAIIYDPYSRHIVVMNGRSQNLMAIDPTTMKVVASLPLGGKLEFAAAAPGHVFVNVESTSEIADVDSKNWTLNQKWQLNGCEDPSGLAIDRKTNRLFSVCGNSKMVVVDAKTGKIVATVPTGAGTDAARFDPGLKLALASNGEGTLTAVREAPDGSYQVAANIATQRGARTMALDPSSHRIFTITAQFGAPVAGERRPPILPGTFVMLVFAPGK